MNMHLVLIATLVDLAIAIPTGMVLKRIGFSYFWALLCLAPILAFCGLWALAFIRWPRDAQPQP